MTDARKFKILIFITTALTFLILSYNVLQGYFMPGIESYLEGRERQRYYEEVISKKGLSLHKGMYWKEKE